jgi:hypothetical protein
VGINGYFRLNYHKLLMIISGATLLMAIDGYSIGGYFRLSYHILLVAILL